ncbi:MAG: DUF6273 domain-containing protein [Clostridiales bacterium]|nr:DUF6273 domain-containing protein [Clostridiales bacterium]
MKIIKKILAIIICLTIVLSMKPISVFAEEGCGFGFSEDSEKDNDLNSNTFLYNVGDVIEFGSYPQSSVTDKTLIGELENQDATWISYGYYSGNGYFGSMEQGKWMLYKDVIYNGVKYRGVYFKTYRPYWTGSPSTSNNSYQDDNGFYIDTTHWFEFQPLKWRVLDPETGLVMCDSIIDSQAFCNIVYCNNSPYYSDVNNSVYAYDYKNSTIRNWLNNNFYNTAFSMMEKNSIITTELDNYSPIYNCGNTYDNVFLLSAYDLLNSNYGFSNSSGVRDSLRTASSTDYAKCQGIKISGQTSQWWLRSPGDSTGTTCDIYYDGRVGHYTEVYNTSQGIRPAICLNTEIKQVQIQYGKDRFTFGQDITGYVGDVIDSLVVYTSANENIASLDITSSNTDVVEIGTIEIGVGDYITTSENEHIATIPLKLKAEGTSTITITSPEGVSISINVTSQKSSYEIKLYSEIPAMIVGKGRQIGAAVQLENNGIVVEENINATYSFVSSNNNIVSLSDIRKESDGTYFTINGIEEGSAVITITENNTGSVFSGVIQVSPGILTFNAEAMPSYYDRNNEYNGYIGGMYIDEFKMSAKDNAAISVTFNVYNTANIVGVVDVYDSDGNIIRSEQIKRFDGGYVTSIKDTLISGYKLVEDIFITKNLLTYKQDNYSVKTQIEIEVPKGGHIEITNDPLYSNTCAIFNYSEFITTSVMLFGDVVSVDANTKKEISEITGKNIVDKFLKEYIAALSGKSYNEKIAKLGEKFIEKLTEKSLKKILSSSITGDLASFVDEGKAILEECDINLGDTIVSAAGSIGISIAESTLKKAMGPFGEVLNGMFKFSEYASYSNFLVDICKRHENHALRIYFDDENGCLSNNGVSVKAENGNTDLSVSNYIMHSVVLSKEQDLSNEIKVSLDNISDKYIVRDIYLERDGVISQPNQTVQVSIPVPNGWIPDYCKVYWVQEDGTLQEIQATASFGNLVFTTDHFSYYAVVEKKPSYIEGDVNGDDSVDSDDAIYLLYYTLLPEDYPINQNGDFNGDGEVNSDDAIYLLYHTLLPDSYPLK